MEVFPIIVPTRSSLKSFNFYIMKDEGSLSLIDAGVNSSKCWDYLNEALHHHGFSLEDLDQIIITHNHEDHVGLVDRIVSSRNIPVYVPEKAICRLKRDRDFFEMRMEFFNKLYKEMGCGVEGDVQIKKLGAAMASHEEKRLKSDVIPIGKQTFTSLEPLETPGHSPDHMIYYDHGQKVIFGGDLLLNHISSNALVEPDESGNRIKTVLEHEQSLKKCASIHANVLYPGHGDIIYDHRMLVEKRLRGISRKASKIESELEQEPRTASDIALTFYKDRYYEQFSLVMSEIIGHLDYLEANGKVTKELSGGVWVYRKLRTQQ
ncbi:MBL fold metallo-hydrolase [Pseudalkalibacillus berkeleyi]|uniref:MBL fold metallo-hydrolase n=1 Tax=Pseudalkalibacillus berkeleyi TaxID=1069813 RepID=A0ABS9H402_9BACL|nr:MBL fold metallo-hydrolase [Pseudalkalibacillus berkeleyi]MCF6138806.1 MBL fold metallo-hydrolase [Pseudalkalibacillus berkeleyi]